MNRMQILIHYLYTSTIVVLTTLFGKHWLLFMIYLLLNILDTITGWSRAKISKTLNSRTGFKGVVNKIGCWMLLLIGFLIPICFKELGQIIHIDLTITVYLGWFILASLMVNELRSIIENLVEIGVKVPTILINGLEVVAQKLDEKNNNKKG